MRSVSTAILLAVLAPLILVFATLPLSSANNVPACCRRDGQHHCAMTAIMNASSETRLSAIPPVCPFRNSPILVSHVVSYLPQTRSLYFANVLAHPAIHEQTTAAYRISSARSHLKRGPPVPSQI